MMDKVDPYVKVEFENQKFKTECFENDTDPFYNEWFTWEVMVGLQY
jgi:Ca2+-dependent lipid-binding protein